MAHLIEIKPTKDYATAANAQKAVEKVISPESHPTIRYFITQGPNGRFYPIFIGMGAINAGIHFHFNVVG